MPREMYSGSIILLFSITWTVIVTIAYAEGLFNDFLKAAISIISCAFDLIFGKIFLGWVSQTRDAIDVHIRMPIRARIDRIPSWIKALLYIFLGISILVLDHLYNTKIFAEDETKFYDLIIFGKKYWFTELALLYGCGILAFGLLYMIFIISEAFFDLIDKRIRIKILVRG